MAMEHNENQLTNFIFYEYDKWSGEVSDVFIYGIKKNNQIIILLSDWQIFIALSIPRSDLQSTNMPLIQSVVSHSVSLSQLVSESQSVSQSVSQRQSVSLSVSQVSLSVCQSVSVS